MSEFMSEQKTHIAVFDFDGTLTTKDTFIEFAYFVHGRLYTWFTILLFSPLLLLMKLHLANNSKVKQLMFSFLYKGMDYLRFKQLGSDFANIIDSFVRKSTFYELNNFKHNAVPIYIVSASIDAWVRPWCVKHGIGNVICTEIAIDNGVVTGKFLTPNCFGPEKVKRLSAAVGTLEDQYVTVFGDSRGDKELMRIANKVFLVQ